MAAAFDRSPKRTAGAKHFAPYEHAELITKSDTVDLVNVSSAIYVGGTGNINAVLVGGETVLFSGIPAGTVLPIRCTRIMSTSTTATLMVALS